MKSHRLSDDFTLCYDMNALCELEDVVGPLPALLTDPARAQAIKTQRAFVWAGLIRKHNKTMKEVGDIVDEIGLDVCAVAVQEAMRKAYPQFFPGDEDDAPGKGEAS